MPRKASVPGRSTGSRNGKGGSDLKLGLTLANTGRFSWDAQLEIVRAADRLGYETLWVAESSSWDAFTQLGWFAAVTERIKVATGVVNVFSRSPALIAQSAATIDRISRGRFVLGLGTSGPRLVSGWHGVPFAGATQRLRETVDIVRLVLARERLVYAGQVFRLDKGMRLAGEPVRPALPIYLATLSPRGLRLTGEVADGWLAAFFSPRRYPQVFHPHLQRGMTKRTDTARSLAICVYHSVVISNDKAAGRDAIRPHLAFYIGAMGSERRNFYNQLFRRYGFVEEADRIQRLHLANRREEAARAVTDAMVDEVAIIGPAGECRERLEEMGGWGVDEVALQLAVPDGSPRAMLAAIEALAPG
jgi:F420-dependent oxidoreductase-like protein